MREFENLRDCIQHVTSTLVIDLKNHATQCACEDYVSLLQPAPPGIYLKGVLEPIVDLRTEHFLLTPNQDTPTIPVRSVADINPRYDVVDRNGVVKLKRKFIYQNKGSLIDDPGYQYGAIRAAAFFATSYLKSFATHSSFTLPYQFSDIFKEEALRRFEEGTLDVFNTIKYEIASFVGNDELFIYYYSLKGSVLQIEKNMDYRIYEYYLKKFEKNDTD